MNVLRALISVYDKSGLVEFATSLHNAGVKLVSTGGTYKFLADIVRIPVDMVSEVANFPEILEGRVKTLHPRIHGGILARRDQQSDMDELREHNILPFDIVINNLYPFQEVASKPGVTLEKALDNIDIGGPSMIRAAAKNFPWVVVVVDPLDYPWVSDRLLEGQLSLKDRQNLAQKAFSHLADYDASIASYLYDNKPFLSKFNLTVSKTADLRYGENPHQTAALYRSDTSVRIGIPFSELLHGKPLSFNNILDADSAWKIVNDFPNMAAVIVKHTNPCGLASKSNQTESYMKAYQGDPISAYGGIVGFNSLVTLDTVDAMRGAFFEVVVAPNYDSDALSVLKRRKNLRILRVPQGQGSLRFDIRTVAGGVLIQDLDDLPDDPNEWTVVTKRHPTESEMEDLSFGWKAVRHVKSNAIVLARDGTLLGIGTGQPNRVNSVFLATEGAGKMSIGSTLASDAFFPFPDNVEAAFRSGVTAIIQPGGSIRDEESIDIADKHDLAMIFTGVRHFKH